MQLNEFLVEAVKYTDGWVIVVVFAMYVAYHVYRKYTENAALTKTLKILDDTISRLLENVSRNVELLTASMDRFFSRARHSDRDSG